MVDDEPLAVEILVSYISNIETLELAGTCSNALEAFSYLQKHSVDVMFLDIQMPKLSGIEFLKSLKNSPKVVFTTAYREYALDGFELEVFDYLLKPISFERFLKLAGKLHAVDVAPTNYFAPTIEHTAIPAKEFMFVNVDKKMVKVYFEEVLYIESLKDYVRLKMKTGKDLVTHLQISEVENMLKDQHFIRIHRSFIVNVRKIEAYNATDIIINGREIPVGRNYKMQVQKYLENI